MFHKTPKRFRRLLKLALIVAGCAVLYINWPALRGRECSGLSRTRDAITIGYYKPLYLEAAEIRRARYLTSSELTADELATTISLAMDYFAKCTAERGMKYCQYVGTDPKGELYRYEDKGGPPRAEIDAYRFIVSEEEAGQSFHLKFAPVPSSFGLVGLFDDAHHNITISREKITSYESEGWRLELGVYIHRCDYDPSSTTLRGAYISTKKDRTGGE